MQRTRTASLTQCIADFSLTTTSGTPPPVSPLHYQPHHHTASLTTTPASPLHRQPRTLYPSSDHLQFPTQMKDLIDFLQKGAKGRELKKEEVVTHERVETSPEQYAQFKWVSQLEQEVERTKDTVESLLQNKEEEKEVRIPVRSLIEPRDIRMLNLSDLQGIEAEGRLTVFLSQVESCSEDLEERKRILMTRVDPQLVQKGPTIRTECPQ
ncbi:hypothetical protein GWK47_054608 [Chionoecetes opilio]|uniref:Uncharacterized protein n=1 Tax=Chionoecetes opilio TaxID=41210 RepID=A0A8J4Y6W2_CHIOP|nr:hypothetical protein GWK47_054608 [Chionoecetes opilio]